MFDIAAIGEVLIDFTVTQSDVRMKMDGSVGGRHVMCLRKPAS